MIPPSSFGSSTNAYLPPTPQQGVYGGIKNYGMQQYLPILEKRQLEKPENKDIEKNLHNWWPRIGAGYNAPMPSLLASEGKSATLSGLGAGAIGAVSGAVMFAKRRILGAAILGPLGAGFGAVTGFINRRQSNENIMDIMKPLPPDATKRDMLSDPVVQKDRELAAMHSASSAGGDILNGLVMASIFNGGFNSRRR